MIAICSSALAAAGCAAVATFENGGQPIAPPHVAFDKATLAETPSGRALAAYFCPDFAPLRRAGTDLCEAAFGPRPPLADLPTSFDVSFRIDNPNRVPLPLTSMLVALTVFPGDNNERLGATCLRACPEGPAGCADQDPSLACQDASRAVHSLSDFSDGVSGFVRADGLASDANNRLSFTAPALAASSEGVVVGRFTLGAAELISVLRELATRSVGDLKAGRPVSFTIPFRIEGTVWFDAGSLGRVPVRWGPQQGTWILPPPG